VKARVVRVHIGELVLRGFVPGGRYQLADAVQNELVRLLSAQPEVLHALRHRRVAAQIDGGEFPLPAGSAPTFVGRQVARAIYKGLKT
jgi:hypothetical protein